MWNIFRFGGITLAKVQEIIDLLNGYNDVIRRMNSSQSEEDTRRFALIGSSISKGIKLGNGEKYIDVINEGFIGISLSAGTKSVLGYVDLVNTGINDYVSYLRRSWWQFGSGDRPQTNEVPHIEYLE